MNTQKKAEWKGMFKGVVVTLLLLGVFSAGVVYAGVTVMSDEGFFFDSNKVLIEEDFTSWTYQWTMDIDDGLYQGHRCSFWIDERDEVLYLLWYDDSQDSRFGIYNLADNSTVNESSDGSDYTKGVSYFSAAGEPGISHSSIDIYDGAAISQSSYILFLRADGWTIEVWRGGATPVWSHNVSGEIGIGAGMIYGGLISPSGKYILIKPWTNETLSLYKGT